ncbi:MAG: hypothetical protein EOM12_12345 [Verrucomicrobiae bacterium]|nr:hypothetical protein [Verrucomicrobiae bacterium]
MMKKILMLVFCLLLTVGTACAETVRVRSAAQFENALENDDVDTIYLNGTVRGNFVTGNRHIKIIGDGNNAKIVASDSKSAALTLTGSIFTNKIVLSGLILETVKNGRCLDVEIGANLSVEKCAFRGRDENTTGIVAKNSIILKNSTFEGFNWAIRITDYSDQIDVQSCSFQEVGQVFEMYIEDSMLTSFEKINVRDSVFSNCWFLFILHKGLPHRQHSFSLDEKSLDSVLKGVAYPIFIRDDRFFILSDGEAEITGFWEQGDAALKQSLASLGRIAGDAASRGIAGELKRKSSLDYLKRDLFKISASEINKQNIIELLKLNLAMVLHPINALGFELNDYNRSFRTLVDFKWANEPILNKAGIRLFLRSPGDASFMSLATPRVSLGRKNLTEMLRDERLVSADSQFRSFIREYYDWLELLGQLGNEAKDLRSRLRIAFSDNPQFLVDVERCLRDIADLAIHVERLYRIFSVDLQVQKAFVQAFSEVLTSPDDHNRIFHTARMLNDYNVMKQRLSLLRSTNACYDVYVSFLKETLKKDKFSELIAILSTESSLLRDRKGIEDFMREWR